jgi:GTP-binding protein
MTNADELEAGRKLFAGPCDFLLGVASIDGLPDDGPPEVAFAGRSNVGKSSLLNALTGRKALARTSNTPGRTRELNFFGLGQDPSAPALRLVDLPGYGYARASRDDVQSWTGLTLDFLKGRASLRRVCVLIDSRHGLKEVDGATMDTLDTAAVPYQLVLTKTDKVKPPAAEAVRAATAAAIARRPAANPDVLLTSSEKGDGIPELRAALAALAA